jgi:hypothetical protein
VRSPWARKVAGSIPVTRTTFMKRYTINEVRQDWKFSEIEKRGLQFLLRGSDKLQYEVWLNRPYWYKEHIRNANIQTSVELTEELNSLRD